MTKLSSSLFLSLALAAVVATCGSASAQSPLPAPTGYVNDFAGVIDQQTKDRLETTLTNLEREQQIQFAVVTVDSTNGQEIFDYSLAVARGWGLGAKDVQKQSLLLLVAIKDRKYYTQVSRHLEGDLPDGLVGQIQREKLVPAFRAGDYGRGVTDTIREYISTVARKRGFSTDSIFVASDTPRRPPEIRSNRAANLCGIIVVLVIVIVIISIFMRRGGGPGGGWVIWMILGSLLSGSRGSSSGWSSGGFGGSGGGGSGGGGFGGFGGGGDFGGGGSGGSW